MSLYIYIYYERISNPRFLNINVEATARIIKRRRRVACSSKIDRVITKAKDVPRHPIPNDVIRDELFASTHHTISSAFVSCHCQRNCISLAAIPTHYHNIGYVGVIFSTLTRNER